jgi:GNAT superfamily N-acetyltransferase
MISFAWEPLSSLLDDGLAAMVERHWHEVGVYKDKMPLSVDWERYYDIEAKGILKVLAARDGEELVGYASYMIMPHLHYSQTVHALNDAIFVYPERRGLGVKMIRAAEKLLAALYPAQWVRIIYHIKTGVEAERGTFLPVFERMGYTAFETCADKMVKG